MPARISYGRPDPLTQAIQEAVPLRLHDLGVVSTAGGSPAGGPAGLDDLRQEQTAPLELHQLLLILGLLLFGRSLRSDLPRFRLLILHSQDLGDVAGES